MVKDDAAQIKDQKADKKGGTAPKKGWLGKPWLLAVLIVAVCGVFAGGFFVVRTMIGKKGAETTVGKKDLVDELVEEAKNPHAAEKAQQEKAKQEGDGEENGQGDKSEKTGEKAGEEAAQDPLSLFFRPAIPVKTNLKGSSLKVTAKVWIEAENEESLKLLHRSEPYIMNALVLLFSGKTREDVSTAEGIEQVTREIKIRVEQLAAGAKVKAVGFEYLTTGSY